MSEREFEVHFTADRLDAAEPYLFHAMREQFMEYKRKRNWPVSLPVYILLLVVLAVVSFALVFMEPRCRYLWASLGGVSSVLAIVLVAIGPKRLLELENLVNERSTRFNIRRGIRIAKKRLPHSNAYRISDDSLCIIGKRRICHIPAKKIGVAYFSPNVFMPFGHGALWNPLGVIRYGVIHLNGNEMRDSLSAFLKRNGIPTMAFPIDGVPSEK